MVGRIPETAGAFLRDYLYVDVGRVRSLLAQLHEGAPEQVSESEQKHRKWSLGLSGVLGIQREGGTDTGRSETRSLSDLHFALFEDVAEQTGFLRDITEMASLAKNWNRAKLHRSLSEGDIIRVTAPTRVVDPRYVGSQFRRLDETFGADSHVIPGGVSSAQIQEMIEALYGPGIVVRAFPAGLDEPQCHMAGTLLDSTGYLESERSTLFSRHGVEAQPWTVVAQIARLPMNQSSQPDTAQLDALGSGMISGDRLDRSKMEEFLVKMMEFLESFGMSEAPQHPAMAITPLAVYRVVTPAVEDA